MRRILRTLPLLLLPVALLAHDTWLMPSTFAPKPGASVRLRLATSMAFPTSEGAAAPDRIARFTLRTAAGSQSVAGYRVEGNFLVADVTPATAGHAVAVLETKPRVLVMKPGEFNEYLKEEGAQQVLAARATSGQSNAPGRERYRKITKTILCVGDAKDASFAQPDNLWLEIIPERSTCGLKSGDTLSVRVLFNGTPFAGAHLAAGYEGPTGHNYPVNLLTDAQGRATVKLDRAGAWYVRTHRILAIAGDPEADWQSAFSTLTFEVLK
ncbi:MAG: DUF4198 domain-containing protein [Acidobacteria bacterium]|nr:DUF4198 domain-containing protein [Acidobacteriota bacterium]MCL5289371.1 DUF4198 domain-containing protein [Acidobacteriota bacterium]